MKGGNEVSSKRISEKEEKKIMKGIENIDFEESEKDGDTVKVKVKKSKEKVKSVDTFISLLINKAKKNGNKLSYSDIDHAIPTNVADEIDSDYIEKIYDALESEGIEILEEEVEEEKDALNETEYENEEIEELFSDTELKMYDNISLGDPIKIYLKEISKVELLSPSRERQLARRAQKGDQKARDELIKANLRLVISIAK
ncbi:MAG: polymerase primary sigma factor, partial [Petrotoga sp.]|nr:polymerase primary sigma factor [Petrotoga sp.]